MVVTILEKLTSKERLIWLCAFIDGEGYVFLSKHKHKTCNRGFAWRCGIRINSTDLNVLLEIKKFYSSTFSKRTIKNVRHKQCFELTLTQNHLRKYIMELESYSIIKKEQLKLLKIALSLLDRKTWKHWKTNPYDGILEKIYCRMKKLNKRGN